MVYSTNGYYECNPSGNDAVKPITALTGKKNIKLTSEIYLTGSGDRRVGLGFFQSGVGGYFCDITYENKIFVYNGSTQKDDTVGYTLTDTWFKAELTIDNSNYVTFNLLTMSGTLISTWNTTLSSSWNNISYGISVGHTSGCKGRFRNIKAEYL